MQIGVLALSFVFSLHGQSHSVSRSLSRPYFCLQCLAVVVREKWRPKRLQLSCRFVVFPWVGTSWKSYHRLTQTVDSRCVSQAAQTPQQYPPSFLPLSQEVAIMLKKNSLLFLCRPMLDLPQTLDSVMFLDLLVFSIWFFPSVCVVHLCSFELGRISSLLTSVVFPEVKFTGLRLLSKKKKKRTSSYTMNASMLTC